jgi:hypothetical protein
MKYSQPDLFELDPKKAARNFTKKWVNAINNNFNALLSHWMLYDKI